ncbi:MAG: peptidase MA family metallohydrolase [Anaerolineae bacterium]|nr:peptidase MA family metallohydrolase [Anaerolineae bacterium]
MASAYPDYIDFAITVASSEANISNATIYRRVGIDGPFEPSIVTVFERARRTTISSRFVVGNYLFPPFTPVTYYWRVRDLQNNELTTAPITVLFEDTSHNWRSIDDGLVVVHWYDFDEAFGQNLSRIAGDAYKRLLAFFGVRPTYKPRVVLLNSQHDFGQFQSFGVELPNVGGQYIPGLGLTLQLIEPGYPDTWLPSVVPHELSHLVSDLYYTTGPGLPIWLEEGLATYNEAINRAAALEHVREMAALGYLIALADLPAAIRSANVNIAILAYRESASVFEFIVARWGAESLPGFLGRFDEPGMTFEDAVRVSFDMDVGTFEREWKVWLGLDLPTFTPAPTQTPHVTRTPVPTVTVTPSQTPDLPTATSAAVGTATPAAIAKRAEHTAVPGSAPPESSPEPSPPGTPAPCLGGIAVLAALGALPLRAAYVLKSRSARRHRGG